MCARACVRVCACVCVCAGSGPMFADKFVHVINVVCFDVVAAAAFLGGGVGWGVLLF